MKNLTPLDIIQIRRSRGLGIAEIAKLGYQNRHTWGRWERGITAPSLLKWHFFMAALAKWDAKHPAPAGKPYFNWSPPAVVPKEL